MAGINSTPTNFYVYLHRRKTDGKVFYVGKGHDKRAWTTDGRNQYWFNIVKKHGFYIEILLNNIQAWYAFELEKETI